VRGQEDATREAWATDVHVDPVPAKAPLQVKNQKRAPCTEGLEVEVSGVCWLPIEKRPCPPQTVSYQGYCLLPVAQPRPPVTSLDGGDGSEPR
jgi:serine/threonine-protein kinase